MTWANKCKKALIGGLVRVSAVWLSRRGPRDPSSVILRLWEKRVRVCNQQRFCIRNLLLTQFFRAFCTMHPLKVTYNQYLCLYTFGISEFPRVYTTGFVTIVAGSLLANYYGIQTHSWSLTVESHSNRGQPLSELCPIVHANPITYLLFVSFFPLALRRQCATDDYHVGNCTGGRWIRFGKLQNETARCWPLDHHRSRQE